MKTVHQQMFLFTCHILHLTTQLSILFNFKYCLSLEEFLKKIYILFAFEVSANCARNTVIHSQGVRMNHRVVYTVHRLTNT